MKNHPARGFTLIEILGSLAIIGILVTLAIPAIRAGARDAKFTGTIKQIESSETACASLAKKPGGPGYAPLTEGAATSAFTYSGTLGSATAATIAKAAILDNVFLAEGYLTKPLDIRLGTNVVTPATGGVELVWDATANAYKTAADAAPTRDYSNACRIECLLTTNAAPSAAAGANFYLGRDTTATGSLPTGARVVSVVIPNITALDAAELANRYNNNSAASTTAANDLGRVAYAAPNTAGLTTAYVYVTHF